jgi:hypothetical protein
MSDRTENQKKAHEFLLDKFNSQSSFTKESFRDFTGWAVSTFDTYWIKQFKTLLIVNEDDEYRVSEAFRRVMDWDNFKKHVTQIRKVATDYVTMTYDNVVLFEFFMPLTNEGHLRTSLDALFFKDSVLTRLKSVELLTLKSKIPIHTEESDDSYFDRICNKVSDTFGGYSISHVNGRYRADRLKTKQEIYNSSTGNNIDSYLVDETTAVVKFIFPCGEYIESQFTSSTDYFDNISSDVDLDTPNADAAVIRWLFYTLFVQSIVQAVNGEDEIWMLESGMRNRLHIWRMDNN